MFPLKLLALAAVTLSGGATPAPRPSPAAVVESDAAYRTTGPFGTYYAAENVAEYLEEQGYVTVIQYRFGSGWYVFYE